MKLNIMKSMFGIDYNSHWHKYIALSGLLYGFRHQVERCPTLAYHVPSGLHQIVPKGRYILGFDESHTRYKLNKV